MGQLSEVPKLAHNACSLYQQHGSPESGANVLDKAAKMIESTMPEQALELYQRAADVVMVYISLSSIILISQFKATSLSTF
jgi:hypothetical protein